MTINYYEMHAKEYIDQTLSCNMEQHYSIFLKHVRQNGKLLDLGFGSGRDMLFFLSQGYDVTGIDPTEAFYKNMADRGYNVNLMTSEKMSFRNEFDGIWACASLLHVNRKNLPSVMTNCYNALKENGVMYCSFKYGNQEIITNERYFNYLNELEFEKSISHTNFKILETYITEDVRADHSLEMWLNVVLRKT